MGGYEYRENGVKFAVIYQDYHGDAPDCYIESGIDNPLSTEGSANLNAEVIQEYGQNLMFEPVPLEFLYTDVQQPQIQISVGGIDAVCPTIDCGYLYVDAVGEITSQSLNDEAVLTI